MSVQVETLEHNMAKLTVEVPAEDFVSAIKNVYNRQKKNISIPGFRKGKVPQIMVERMYGPSVFYEDAANDLLPKAYDDALKEEEVKNLKISSRPNVDIKQMEKGKPFIFTAEVAVRPDVKLGDYKGLEVTKQDVAVTDEDVENQLKNEQEQNARLITVEDRPVEKGDQVTLDYRGTIDGKEFSGGTAEGQELEIGSGTFIPGFEDQLIGMNIGDEKDVEVTFPEDYYAEDLKGKDAVFHCTIHNIQKKELPELNDEFAEDVSEFDTLEEYKADVRKNLEKSRQDQAMQARRDEAASQASQNAEIDIPDLMIQSEAERLLDNIANNLRTQGMDFQTYLQYTGQTYEQALNGMKPQAEQQLRSRLTLEKIAEVENIEVSDEEVDEEIERMAKQYGIETDKMKDIIAGEERENLRSDLQVRKAADFLGENSVEVEKKEESEESGDEAKEENGEAPAEE
ncbi:MAG: trigger factor [Bilifractor sp.]|jgi:trigger factor